MDMNMTIFSAVIGLLIVFFGLLFINIVYMLFMQAARERKEDQDDGFHDDIGGPMVCVGAA